MQHLEETGLTFSFATCTTPLQIGQASLQARGREHSRMLADLKQTEAELARFRGLPTDDAAARATAAEKRGELERLRRRLQEHVNAMQ